MKRVVREVLHQSCFPIWEEIDQQLLPDFNEIDVEIPFCGEMRTVTIQIPSELIVASREELESRRDQGYDTPNGTSVYYDDEHVTVFFRTSGSEALDEPAISVNLMFWYDGGITVEVVLCAELEVILYLEAVDRSRKVEFTGGARITMVCHLPATTVSEYRRGDERLGTLYQYRITDVREKSLDILNLSPNPTVSELAEMIDRINEVRPVFSLEEMKAAYQRGPLKKILDLF